MSSRPTLPAQEGRSKPTARRPARSASCSWRPKKTRRLSPWSGGGRRGRGPAPADHVEPRPAVPDAHDPLRAEDRRGQGGQEVLERLEAVNAAARHLLRPEGSVSAQGRGRRGGRSGVPLLPGVDHEADQRVGAAAGAVSCGRKRAPRPDSRTAASARAPPPRPPGPASRRGRGRPRAPAPPTPRRARSRSGRRRPPAAPRPPARGRPGPAARGSTGGGGRRGPTLRRGASRGRRGSRARGPRSRGRGSGRSRRSPRRSRPGPGPRPACRRCRRSRARSGGRPPAGETRRRAADWHSRLARPQKAGDQGDGQGAHHGLKSSRSLEAPRPDTLDTRARLRLA